MAMRTSTTTVDTTMMKMLMMSTRSRSRRGRDSIRYASKSSCSGIYSDTAQYLPGHKQCGRCWAGDGREGEAACAISLLRVSLPIEFGYDYSLSRRASDHASPPAIHISGARAVRCHWYGPNSFQVLAVYSPADAQTFPPSAHLGQGSSPTCTRRRYPRCTLPTQWDHTSEEVQ